MRLRTLVPLVAVLAAAPAAAQETQTYRSPAGFSLQLPARWQQMDDAELEVVRRAVARTDMSITYEAGFRVGTAPWPAPPVAAIARAPLGQKVTMAEFGAMFGAANAQETMQEEIDNTAAAQAGGRVAPPRWDAQNHVAWVRMALQSDGTTPAFAWMAATLHPDGETMLAVLYYGARGEDEARVRADLLAVLRSLRTG